MKRTPLKRRSPLRGRRKAVSFEPGREEWKAPVFGHCRRCGTPGALVRHHILTEQLLRREAPEQAWNQDNALLLGHHFTCGCHARHTSAFQKLPLELLPEAAVAFAVDVLGEDRAAEYLRTHYDCGSERAGGDRVVTPGRRGAAPDAPTGPLSPALFDTEPEAQSDSYRDVE